MNLLNLFALLKIFLLNNTTYSVIYEKKTKEAVASLGLI